MIKTILCTFILITIPFTAIAQNNPKPFRPPAVPLVTHDPYFSAWSFNNNLSDDWPKHWTGAAHAMCGLIRIDGKPYRWMGAAPRNVPAMAQKSVEVLPTRTIYEFEQDGVALTVTFLTPALPRDLDVLSRPVTYVVLTTQSTDGKGHKVDAYLDLTAEWAVDKPNQQVVGDRIPGIPEHMPIGALRFGTKDQKVLDRRGDNLRIDWGHVILAKSVSDTRTLGGPVEAHATGILDDVTSRETFVSKGHIRRDEGDDKRFPRAASDKWPVLAHSCTLTEINNSPKSMRFMIAYDDEYSIEHMGAKLRPWWKRDGMQTLDMLSIADRDYDTLLKTCIKFDEELMADAKQIGGEDYARLCALSYRQCLAAHKLVASADGKTPLYFSKENFSNGCIATVDVTYPSAPMFLLLNPTLLKGMTTPILDYAQTDRWKFPFAPHDLGQYPKANGQVYGGGERSEKDQMPVEECGNMLILLAAIAHAEGNADYANKYWPTLTKWANYLKEKGLDPENQLCTDDFAGHLAHNTNLSLKAIVALASYAKLAQTLGKTEEAATYRKSAEEMAAKWQQMANDGDHYRLTFDKENTWSQKYNLVWDKLLSLNLFPKQVAQQEIAYYKTKLNKFGLPLDDRKTYTKLDWIVWSATLADNRADFDAIMQPTYDWISATPTRVPLTDWYDTVSGRQQGFQARSVVGGVYIKFLESPDLQKKYASRAK
jgi:hypothetical protein